MATVLYRLGAWVVRHRRTVLVLWLIALAAAGGAAAAFKGATSTAFEIPGTESQRAIDLLAAKFPGAGGAFARVVIAAPPGQKVTDPKYAGLARASLAAVAHAPQVVAVTGFDQATISKNGQIAFGDVHYAVPVANISSAAKDALEALAGPARHAGLQVEFSGGVISTTSKDSGTDILGVIVAFLVLGATFGALLTAGLPLMTAAVGVGVALLGVTALSGSVSITATAPTLALMIGLAVGIDYALFILSRHRQQLAQGMPVEESIPLATATAGGAVVFAGLTVVIALSALAVVGIPFLSVMGLAAASTVVIAVLVAITLVPALLAIIGPRLNAGAIKPLAKRQAAVAAGKPMGQRWSEGVTRRPILALVVGVAVVAVIALPTLSLQLGLPDDSSKPTSTTERRAYDLLTEGFGAGFTGPLTVVVDAPGQRDPKALATEAVRGLAALPDVAAVSMPVLNPTGDIAIIQVTPSSDPASEKTRRLVTTIRAKAKEVRRQADVTAYVTGATAANIDVSAKLGAALPVFVAVIVVLAFFLLMLVFRSLLVPLKAVLGFLFSIAASLGLVVWIFQEGHLGGLFGVATPGPVVSFLPVLLIGILFGLAMDYEVFLVSRMREDYVHRREPLAAINAGMRASARVVTAAGLIMISVFGGFVFGDDVIIKSIGLALAFGVLVDAFLVRMTLVPATLALLGRHAWSLPSWLDRLLPDLDIDGVKLEAQIAQRLR